MYDWKQKQKPRLSHMARKYLLKVRMKSATRQWQTSLLNERSCLAFLGATHWDEAIYPSSSSLNKFRKYHPHHLTYGISTNFKISRMRLDRTEIRGWELVQSETSDLCQSNVGISKVLLDRSGFRSPRHCQGLIKHSPNGRGHCSRGKKVVSRSEW